MAFKEHVLFTRNSRVQQPDDPLASDNTLHEFKRVVEAHVVSFTVALPQSLEKHLLKRTTTRSITGIKNMARDIYSRFFLASPVFCEDVSGHFVIAVFTVQQKEISECFRWKRGIGEKEVQLSEARSGILFHMK